jgi:hypothetical protein
MPIIISVTAEKMLSEKHLVGKDLVQEVLLRSHKRKISDAII